MTADTTHFGAINQGEYRVFTFTFKQNVTTPGTGTPTDPSGGAFVNMTPPGGTKTDYPLHHASGGVYTLAFSGDIPGFWTGTAFAPAGTGQAAQPFVLEILSDPNLG